LTSFKKDQIELEFAFERLEKSTKEFEIAEKGMFQVTSYFRENSLSDFADEVFRIFYGIPYDYEKEIETLEKVRKLLIQQRKVELEQQNREYEQSQ
jgi:hypothetical protein